MWFICNKNTNMYELIIVSIYFITPVILIKLTKVYSVLDKIGVVVLTYLFGFLMTFSGFLPENVFEIQEVLSSIVVAISIPLLLFSTNVATVLKLKDSFFKSLFIGLFSIIVSVVSGYYIFMKDVSGANKIAGLLTGVYTGGTPNLASIKVALNIDASTYILVHSTDLIIGAFYLLFFITIAQKLLNKILPIHVNKKNTEKESESKVEQIDLISEFSSENRKKSIVVIGLAVFIFGIGGGLSLLFPEKYGTTIAILSITTFGVLFSLYKPINSIKQSFSLGMYLILVFNIIVASMVDVNAVGVESINLLCYVMWAMFVTFIIQVILAKIFKIDSDITIITATALSMSPPFVPIVAVALNNKNIIVPGIVIGLLGYVIGNYLGVFIAYSL